jgi:hypothetical protein
VGKETPWLVIDPIEGHVKSQPRDDLEPTVPASKKHAVFRFYGCLNDFLPAADRQSDVRYAFWGRPAIKDAVEAQGVPHPEVDLIVTNGRPVGFDASLAAGDRVSVYPWIKHLDRPDAALRPSWPSPLRFLCDVHLGRLARQLRMLGLDTRYDRDLSDAVLARLSDEETRVLLTRDLELLKRARIDRGAFIRSDAPTQQFAEVVRRFPVGSAAIDPFSRCLDCNASLQPADEAVVAETVPPHARRVNDAFWRCPSCDTVYWEGTHVERMRRRMRRVLDKVNL